MSQSTTNHLLAIGIDQYQSLPQLHNAVKDAKEVVSVLLEKYQFSAADTEQLYDSSATKTNIVRSFKNLVKRVKPEDNVVIYFSGHGEYDTTFKEGYWMPVNAKPESISNAIPNGLIKTMLSAMDCHHLFVIVDSCFSGTLFNRGGGRAAERLQKHSSRWGLTSGRNEIVMDGAAGTNSPFAESVLYLLKNNTEPIGVSELCNKVVEVTASNASQTPLGEPLDVSGHKGGQMVFYPKRTEEMDWGITQGSEDPMAYQQFLEQYPNGKYSAVARAKIQREKATSIWSQITSMPDSTLLDMEKKIQSISSFIREYKNSPNYNTALKLGENLEYKQDFYRAKDSGFKLRQFAQKKSPFQAEALQLIAAMESGREVISNTKPSSTVNPRVTSSPSTPANSVEPSYGLNTPATNTSSPKWKGLLLLIPFVIILLGGYFYFASSAEKPFIEIRSDKQTGGTTIQFYKGVPPYEITIQRNGEAWGSVIQETKATIDITSYLKKDGQYQIAVEDADGMKAGTGLVVASEE